MRMYAQTVAATSWWTRLVLPLWLGAVVSLGGCSAWNKLASHVDDRSDFDAAAIPPPRPISGLAEVWQRRGMLECRRGSGFVVHSCRKHGTYLITAYHVVAQSDRARVFVYDFNRPKKHDEVVFSEATVVLPKRPPRADRYGFGDVIKSEDAFRLGAAIVGARDPVEKAWLVFIATFDFAIVRLDEDIVVPCLPLAEASAPEPADGASVELWAVMPERYPHIHSFSWTDKWPAEVFQPGHSGAPIVCNRGTIAIAANAVVLPGDPTPRIDPKRANRLRPTLAAIREEASRQGLGFLFADEHGSD